METWTLFLRASCGRLKGDFSKSDSYASFLHFSHLSGVFRAGAHFSALDGQQLLVVEGSGWRGRRESDSQVFCQTNSVHVCGGMEKHIVVSVLSAPQPPQQSQQSQQSQQNNNNTITTQPHNNNTQQHTQQHTQPKHTHTLLTRTEVCHSHQGGGGGPRDVRRPTGTEATSSGGAAGHPCGARAAAERSQPAALCGGLPPLGCGAPRPEPAEATAVEGGDVGENRPTRRKRKKRRKKRLPKASSLLLRPVPRTVRTRKSGHLSCGSSWCSVSGCCLTCPGSLDPCRAPECLLFYSLFRTLFLSVCFSYPYFFYLDTELLFLHVVDIRALNHWHSAN